MSYFPINSGGEVTIDGVPHKGKLKLKNEYIPIVSPASVVETFSTADSFSQPSGAIEFRGDLLLLAYRGSQQQIGYGAEVLKMSDGFWKDTRKWIYPMCNMLSSYFLTNYCYIGDDIYYYNKYSSWVGIYKLNADLTETTIASTPQHTTYSTGMGHFKNDNGEDCLIIYNSYNSSNNYYYNLATETWTTFTRANLPTSYPRNMYYVDKPNTVLWEFGLGTSLGDGSVLYEYNVATNTFTNVSTWNHAQSDGTISRVNKTLFMIPIECNNSTYYLVCCNVDVSYYNSTWQTKNVYCVLDENRNVIATLDDISPISVFRYSGCIGFLTVINDRLGSGNSRTNAVGAKFYKFDPKTRTMYDMSIPHLVIDES